MKWKRIGTRDNYLYCFYRKCGNDYITDADSDEEDQVLVTNLQIRQLRIEADFSYKVVWKDKILSAGTSETLSSTF